jgi:hypothetical protein
MKNPILLRTTTAVVHEKMVWKTREKREGELFEEAGG